MKFRKSVCLLALCLLLSACEGALAETSGGAAVKPPPQDTAPVQDPPSLAEDEKPTVITCRVVDGAENGDLLLAELDEGIYGGSGVYRLDLGREAGGEAGAPAVPVYLDGELADASALEDGMAVEVAFNGSVAESFPAQLGEVYSVSAWSRGQAQNPMGTAYDLCGLYLQVLDDLWQRDPALNENISQIALDLSQAPGELTEGEQAALVWRFGELHGVEAFAATFEELEKWGYLHAQPLGEDTRSGAAFLHWEDGCLFSIKANENLEDETYSLPVIFFDAEKWRSSLAAYCFYDCSAMWAEGGSWNGYQIGGEMIS